MFEEYDYDWDYSDDDSNSESDFELENQYWANLDLKETDPEAALGGFQRLLEHGGEGPWGVPHEALNQIIRIHLELDNRAEMMLGFKKLLTFLKSARTRNRSAQLINSIFSLIYKPEMSFRNTELLKQLYEATLEALKGSKNESLWFSTNIKLGKLYYDRGELNTLAKLLKRIHKSCKTVTGQDDTLNRGPALIEIYALEMQMYTDILRRVYFADYQHAVVLRYKDTVEALYNKALGIESAITHPRTLAVIRECGGMVQFCNHQYQKAYVDFFEALKYYEESFSPRTKFCVKYLILASMYIKSGVNPLDAPETKKYKNDPEIRAMEYLAIAYQNNHPHIDFVEENFDVIKDPLIKERLDCLIRFRWPDKHIKRPRPYLYKELLVNEDVMHEQYPSIECESDVDLTNQYLDCVALQECAVLGLARLARRAGGPSAWGVKALTLIIKLHFRLRNSIETVSSYRQLLAYSYMKSPTIKILAQESIVSIFEYITSRSSVGTRLFQQLREITLEPAKYQSNDRSWTIKLVKLFCGKDDFETNLTTFKQMHKNYIKTEEEEEKELRELLEINALEMEKYTDIKCLTHCTNYYDRRKLNNVYKKSLHISSVVSHPVAAGVIRECGGKMYLLSGKFEKAHSDFLEAFKIYVGLSSSRSTSCLKYLILSNMLINSETNILDYPGAEQYKDDPQILAMASLAAACENDDVPSFVRTLQHQKIVNDPDIVKHIITVLRSNRRRKASKKPEQDQDFATCCILGRMSVAWLRARLRPGWCPRRRSSQRGGHDTSLYTS